MAFECENDTNLAMLEAKHPHLGVGMVRSVGVSQSDSANPEKHHDSAATTQGLVRDPGPHTAGCANEI